MLLLHSNLKLVCGVKSQSPPEGGVPQKHSYSFSHWFQWTAPVSYIEPLWLQEQSVCPVVRD